MYVIRRGRTFAEIAADPNQESFHPAVALEPEQPVAPVAEYDDTSEDV